MIWAVLLGLYVLTLLLMYRSECIRRRANNLKTYLRIVCKEKDMIEGVMTTEEKAICSIAPETSTGKPATVDGIPVWVVDDPSGILGPIVVSEDGMSCEIPSSEDITGTGAMVTVSADADLGEGVVTITEGFIFTVNHPMATSLRGGIQVVPK